MFSLRRANQELLFKYENLESLSITVNRKRRSATSANLFSSNFDHYSNSNSKKLNFSNQFSANAYLFDKASLEHEQSEFHDIEEDTHDLDIFKVI